MNAYCPLSPVLELNAASFHTRKSSTNEAIWLVDRVTLSVMPGEILALVGRNGAGKTSLIRMIAGLTRADHGDVKLNGAPMEGFSCHERARHIAYVGQSSEPDGRLSVKQYVALGLMPHGGLKPGCQDQRVDEALRIVGLEGFASRKMQNLSGGERQRTMLARALCQRPSLLVLDEPTNHLDPSARGELLSLVASLGIAVVASLHDLTLVDDFADHVAVLENGRLIALGTPIEALTSERVRAVFDVDLHRLPNPVSGASIPVLDVPIVRTRNLSLTDFPTNPKGRFQ
ncbi:ABC transporter ATP-binding protein [Roseibium sp.]|uniref:ABC transporter ATP-binding protein n=1 Tax=Roseibium sp. TaxID=1936156 RepID=UPI003BAA3610